MANRKIYREMHDVCTFGVFHCACSKNHQHMHALDAAYAATVTKANHIVHIIHSSQMHIACTSKGQKLPTNSVEAKTNNLLNFSSANYASIWLQSIMRGMWDEKSTSQPARLRRKRTQQPNTFTSRYIHAFAHRSFSRLLACTLFDRERNHELEHYISYEQEIYVKLRACSNSKNRHKM